MPTKIKYAASVYVNTGKIVEIGKLGTEPTKERREEVGIIHDKLGRNLILGEKLIHRIHEVRGTTTDQLTSSINARRFCFYH